MAFGEQLFEDATFEHDGHPRLFEDNEIMAKVALIQTVEIN
ncbi:MAG TPA: hypothetical protein VIM31_03210 [Candidatus Microsaccharimonas sp.]|jgi:hypothetical protein